MVGLGASCAPVPRRLEGGAGRRSCWPSPGLLLSASALQCRAGSLAPEWAMPDTPNPMSGLHSHRTLGSQTLYLLITGQASSS